MMLKQRGRKSSPAGVLAATLPIVVLFSIPFAVFFVETRLHLAILDNDYEITKLKGELQKARERIHALTVRKADLEDVQRIYSQESYLGLVPIDPGSITVIDASTELASSDVAAEAAVQEPASPAASKDDEVEGHGASEAAL